jgi:hypothetical protein
VSPVVAPEKTLEVPPTSCAVPVPVDGDSVPVAVLESETELLKFH